MGERELPQLLATGKAFADLSFWRKVAVSGGDGFRWLNDLVSADISGLRPGAARRALLLSPTGRVRAEFTISPTTDGVLLLQDPSQPEPVDGILARYVLSSNVTLEDRTERLALFSLPGLSEPPQMAGATGSSPSCLGRGVDLLGPARDHDHLLDSLRSTFALGSGEDVESWRVLAGIPRFGVDGSPEDLPQECGLEDAVAFGKGCYLGQEAMAKVRNLGHPRRVLVHLESPGPMSPGQAVTQGGNDVGAVTSEARLDGRTVVLARVAWGARGGPFEASSGGELRLVGDFVPARPDQAPAR